MAKLHLTLIFLFSTFLSFAQTPGQLEDPFDIDIIPPAPTAAGLGKYGDVPVSQFNGLVNVSIPLWTAEGRQLSVPISLSYHASGLKVEEMASNVGLGWSLNAGGVITRTVKGLPDECPNGGYFMNPDIRSSENIDEHDPDDLQYLQDIMDGKIDNEPDMFYFNFAGYAGKFVFDLDGNPRILDYQLLDIQRLSDDAFLVITPDGTKYFFGETLEGEIITDVTNIVQLGNRTPHACPGYNSTWHLTHIIAANNTDTITFDYDGIFVDQEISYTRGQTRMEKVLSSDVVPGTTFSCSSALGSSTSINTVRLSQQYYLAGITTVQNKVEFISSVGNRQDLENSPQLNAVVVKDYKGQTHKTYTLKYSYFDHVFPGNNDLSDYKRLKLLSVQEKGNEQGTLPAHLFTYDATPLPSRKSLAQDHWGFYNGELNNDVGYILVPEMTYDGEYYPGSKKTSSSPHMQAGILKKIQYPTGGYTEFEYEGNTYLKATPTNGVETFDEEVFSTGNVCSTVNTGCDINLNTCPNQSELNTCLIGSSQSKVFTLPSTANPTVEIEITLPLTTFIRDVVGPPLVPQCVSEYRLFDLTAQTEVTLPLYSVIEQQGDPTLDGNHRKYTVSIALNPGNQYELFNASHCDAQFQSKLKATWTIPTSNEFTYEDELVGGVRIRSVKSYPDAASEPLEKTYEYKQFDGDAAGYSSGKLVSPFPKYDFTLKQAIFHSDGLQSGYHLCEYWGRSSTSKSYIGTTNGSPVGYPQVTAYQGNPSENIGKVEQLYSFVEDQRLPYPFNGGRSTESDRGKLLEEITYEKTPIGYTKLLKTKNTYETAPAGDPSHKNIKAIVVAYETVGYDLLNSGFISRIWEMFDFQNFDIQARRKYLSKVETTVYDKTNINRAQTTTTTYKYENAKHGLVTEEERTNSDGTIYITRYKYPHDFNFSSCISLEEANCNELYIADCYAQQASCKAQRNVLFNEKMDLARQWYWDWYDYRSQLIQDNCYYLGGLDLTCVGIIGKRQDVLVKYGNYLFNKDAADAIWDNYDCDGALETCLADRSCDNDDYEICVNNNLAIASEEVKVIMEMKRRNMGAMVLEQSTYVKKNGIEKLISSRFNSYKAVDRIDPFTDHLEPYILLDKVWTMDAGDGISNFSPLQLNEGAQHTLFKDGRYRLMGTFEKYDRYGNIITFQRNHDVPTSIQWGVRGSRPVASFKNGERTQDEVGGAFSFLDFEEENTNSVEPGNDFWMLNTGNSFSTDAYSGLASRSIQPESRGPVRSFEPENSTGKFELTAWFKTASGFGNDQGKFTIEAYRKVGGQQTSINTASSKVEVTVGSSQGNWTFVEAILDFDKIRAEAGIPVSEALGFTVYISNTDVNLALLVDALIVRSYESLVNTLSYNEIGLRISELDNNDNRISYNYDEFLRLETIRDLDGNILANNNYYFGTGVNDPNYVRIVLPRIEISSQAGLINLGLGDQTTTVDYIDGLGRNLQNVIKAASTNNQDIVKPIVYDHYGRPEFDYLAYIANGNTGDFYPNALTEQESFYQNNNPEFDPTTVAYAQTKFEASPLNRPLEQASPGEAWAMGNGHTVSTYYRLNNASDVRLWQYDTYRAYSTSYYAEGEISITRVTNEEGVNTIEYTDKFGRVILTKQQYAVTPDGNGNLQNQFMETYNVYDDFGNLIFVIPPKAVQEMQQNGTYDTYYVGTAYVYQYKYDERQRLIEERIPGADWKYYIYDNLDRPILSQTGNQRSVREWSFMKYDKIGREILSGIFIAPYFYSRTDMQNWVNNHLINGKNHEDRSGYYPTYYHGYTTQAFPTSGYHIHTINHYDDYDFDFNGTADIAADTELLSPLHNSQTTPPIPPQVPRTEGRTKGLMTRATVKVLDNAMPKQWLHTTSFYDEKSRPTQVISDNHIGGTTVANSWYNFVGDVTYNWIKHNNGFQPATLIKEKFEYDNQGRITESWQQYNNDSPVLLAENKYNILGEVKEKNVHSTNYGTSFLQSVDFDYNVRGWLTHINNANLDNLSGRNNDVNDLFGMEIKYNQTDNSFTGVTPLHDGNISQIFWQSASDRIKRGYTYSYDDASRIKSARYRSFNGSTQSWTNDIGHFDLNQVIYDVNGNIQTLKRNGYRQDGSYGLMDDLTYTYGSGNQLQAVSDNAPVDGHMDFNETYQYSLDYYYDQNGNATSDFNKNVYITYNHLNLPVRIYNYLTYNLIEYKYDATGNKLRKLAWKWQPNVYGGQYILEKMIDYTGQFVYDNYDLQFIFTPEGRVVPNDNQSQSNAFRFEYHYSDHLGNMRLAYADLNNDGTIDENNEILQTENYYPFGLSHRYANPNVQIGSEHKFKFNGVELDDEFGVNYYTTTFRQLDASIGRWLAVDPEAKTMFAQSSYVAFNSNPILLVDPDGDLAWIPEIDVEGNVTLKAEEGDTKKSLIKFFKGKERAKKYLGSSLFQDGREMKFDKGYVVKFTGTDPFSRIVKHTMQAEGATYNCHCVATTAINNQDPTRLDWYNPEHNNTTNMQDATRDQILEEDYDPIDPDDAVFGETLIRYEGHSAVYFGMDNEENVYVFQKWNASSEAEIEPISSNNGFSIEGLKEGHSGYYNINRSKAKKISLKRIDSY